MFQTLNQVLIFLSLRMTGVLIVHVTLCIGKLYIHDYIIATISIINRYPPTPCNDALLALGAAFLIFLLAIHFYAP